ncbi:MAG: adenylate/guanylate cyclase domain-containing protein [Actinomycetota bacterium]|nr:adenylate/guanylate cyclase domain-containing protein [Actinomycetota bacterium]
MATYASVGFVSPVFFDPADETRIGLLNGPLIAAYLVLCGVVITRRAGRHLADALRWVAEGREPGEREHRLTLGLARDQVKVDAVAWAAGAVVFAGLNAVAQSWGFAALVGAVIWLGGETTCALEYLMAERILRPVTARALAAKPAAANSAPGVRMRLAMAWLLGTGVPLLGVLVVGVAGVAKPGVHTQYIAAAVVFLSIVASVAGMCVTLFAAKAIAHPITSVRLGLERIERGELDTNVPVDDASEVGLLQAGFNRMAEGLRERKLIRDLFGRQVGEEVARTALADGVRLGGEEREVGALFVDVVGSTSMALAMPATEVVRLLNRFFGVVIEVVEAEGGFVNKFQGDAALCVFGAPVPREDPAGDALRAARELAGRLSRALPEIDFGIGISAGIAVAGNIGAENRFEYTVIGDPVNEAARLSELAKQRPERVLASEAALARTPGTEALAWSVTDSTILRGRGLPTGVAHPRS